MFAKPYFYYKSLEEKIWLRVHEIISNWRQNSQLNRDPGASGSPFTNLHLDWSEEQLRNIVSKPITSSLLFHSRDTWGRWQGRGTTGGQKQTTDGVKYVKTSLLKKYTKEGGGNRKKSQL